MKKTLVYLNPVVSSLSLVVLMVSAGSACAQPNQSTSLAMMTAFIEHPTHCQSLLDGRAGVVLDDQSKAKPQDEIATADLKAMLAVSGDDQQRSSIMSSLMQNCSRKVAGSK